MALTEQQAPFTEPYAQVGNPNGFKSKGPTAEAVKRALAHLGFIEWNPPFDQHYNARVNDAAAAWKRKRGLIPTDSNDGSWGKQAHAVMRYAWYGEDKKPAFDSHAQNLLQKEKAGQAEPLSKVPELGPVWKGGLSILDHDLTHATSGIPLYPAFDDAFIAGREIIAPDDIEIWKKDTGANPGEAVYAKGIQLVDFWIGHIDRDHPLGSEFKKGAVIGKVVPTDIGGGPHTHIGVNIERLLGVGKELLHQTNYTHGSPTVGVQLEKLL